MPHNHGPRVLLHFHDAQSPDDEEGTEKIVVLADEQHTRCIKFLSSADTFREIIKSRLGEIHRPSSYDLFMQLCVQTDRRPIDVLLHRLEDGTYIGSLHLVDSTGSEMHLYCLPLDGLIFSLKSECPLYASRDILHAMNDDASEDAPDEEELDAQFHHSFPGFDPHKKH